jgi:capsular exopolysaccharide synthesis family protein
MTDEPRDAEPTVPAEPAPRSGRSRAAAPPNLRVEPGRDEGVRLVDYVRMIYRRRWLAVTVFLIVVGGTLVYTLTATPIYEARTRLQIEADDPNVVSFKSVIDEQQARADYYTTQYNVLQSRSLARMTLESLKLWETPPFSESPQGSGWSVKNLIRSIGGFVSGLWRSSSAPGRDGAADETEAQSRAIDVFLEHVSVSPIRNSRLVDVSFRLPNPSLAAEIANKLAENYQEQSVTYKFEASKKASSWLEGQLATQKRQVEDAERQLQQYREVNGAISLTDRENIVVQKLSLLNAEVTKAKTDRIQQEAMYMQLQQRRDQATLETFPAIITNAYLQQQKGVLADLLREEAQLSETYGAKNEKIIKIKSQIQDTRSKLDAEIQKVLQSVQTEYQAAVEREKNLVRALEDQKAEALRMNDKAIEYNVLQREVDSNKQIYDSLLQRAKETGVSSALDKLGTTNIRIVDRAEKPRFPASPRTALDLMLAVIGGALLAVGIVFFFDRIDDRLKTPDEIAHHLGLPHLGLLPLVSKSQASSGYPLLGRAVPPNFAEAFRVIRTNVLFSSADPGGQSVLVTSTGPGEGKSLVAANLAISLAQAGKRVLLLDADLRKPMVHQVFDVPQEPGLSNYLVGSAKAGDVVIKSFIEGLWLCPAGRLPPNPAELLGSDRCASFLRALRDNHFDWVVVDSPPVMAVADSSIISHVVSGVLFVVGADMTSRHAAGRAVDQLESTRARFFGAVLNRADLERNAYYYRQYYRREYATYYHGDAQA